MEAFFAGPGAFYVLEGEVEFFLDGEWRRTGAGAFVAVPPNVGFDERLRSS